MQTDLSHPVTKTGFRSLAFPLHQQPNTALWLASMATLIFAILLVLIQHAGKMDAYELPIFIGMSAIVLGLGCYWRNFACWLPIPLALAWLSGQQYAGDLARHDSVFLLKYFLSSQMSVLWMCLTCVLATAVYWLNFFLPKKPIAKIATGMTWVSATFALLTLLVRWQESYLIGADFGHIPVSNLYEVFVLFALISFLLYLYYQNRFDTYELGGFVLFAVSAALAFLLWYSLARQAQQIQPLVPALQSWWMKIHVPANFIGYGAFCLSAMTSVAWLLAKPASHRVIAPAYQSMFRLVCNLVSVFSLLIGLIAYVYAAQHFSAGLNAVAEEIQAKKTYGMIGFSWIATAIIAFILGNRGIWAKRFADTRRIDEISFASIAIGFLFFTLATILGAFWAADAWGSYWSWDPKETWAFIVWINYAAWLHIRLIAFVGGKSKQVGARNWMEDLMAWWAVVGLFITLFAFLGVNMWLSGLHSYGTL